MGQEVVTEFGLSKKLTDDLIWRKKELKLIKDKIPTTKNPLQSAMLRSVVPVLYAHWEGFVKVAMSNYLEHVAKKYLNNDVLTSRFLTLSIQNKISDFFENSFETKVKVIEALFAGYRSRSNIPKKNIINTKSNLTFVVLQEILFVLDLDNDPHIDKNKNLINDLVDLRNHIAHGEYNVVDYDTYEKFHEDIIALMEYLKTKIENCAAQKSYHLATPLIV